MPQLIDLEKLENLIITSSGWQARCAACAENEEDSHSRNHLGIQRDGKFNCLKYSGDKQHLARILQLVGTESDGTAAFYNSSPQEPKIKVSSSWPLSILDKLIFDYNYFESRKISAKTQKYFKMGFANSGQLNGRMIIPVLSPQKDKIIGFTGRLTNYTKWHKDNKIPKWKHLNPANEFIFCGDEKEVSKSRKILITEGPADILALYEGDIKNTICLFGTSISSKQLSFLIKNNLKEIIIGLNNEPDNNNIGNIAAEKLKNTLMNYFDENKIKIGLPQTKGCKDFNDLLMHDEKLLDEYREKWLS